jgi:hypothetical protein
MRFPFIIPFPFESSKERALRKQEAMIKGSYKAFNPIHI